MTAGHARRPVAPGPSPELARRGAVTGLLIALGVYLAHALSFRHYVNDDAYITFRYSRFLWRGLGPYYNVGERVEGYSNFLLMVLMVPVLALGGEGAVPAVAKLIGLASGALCLVLAFGLVLVLGDEGIAPEPVAAGTVAAGLVAVSPSFAVNSVSGLETTLFGAGVTAGVFLAALGSKRDRWYGAGLAFAAALLTRPEGPLLFAVHWVARAASESSGLPGLGRLLRGPRPWSALREDGAARRLMLDAAVVGGVFLAHVAFRRLAYDGEWLPNTYYAKVGGLGVGVPYIVDGILSPLGGIIGIAMAVVGLVLGRALSRQAAPAAAVAVVGALLPLLVGGDWMPGQRMLMPFLPLAGVFVAIGWCGLATRLIRRPAWMGPLLPLIVVALLWFAQGPSRAALLDLTSMRARGYRDGHVELANWLCRSATRPGEVVALMDIGIVGYRCIDRTILDVTGLTNRVIAKSPGGFLDKRVDVGYIFEQRPRVIVLALARPSNSDRSVGSLRVGPGLLQPFTWVEVRLWESPTFLRWYRRPSGPPVPGGSWIDDVANNVGAAKVFLHESPGVDYLLAAFTRRDPPSPGPE